MLCCTRVAVVPRKMSWMKRCPWVLMATRSQPFCSHPLDDLRGRVAVSQFRLGGNAGRLELGVHVFQIGEVCGNLRTDGVGAIGARGPAVGHVQQHQAAVRQPCQLS